MIKETLGGNRLGSGNKQTVEMKTYERSTHDKSYLWRSTMAAGTLVPFLNELALPGDTWDLDLDADIKTHPTIGPLFGSYKVQLDVFVSFIRLYVRELHNNKLDIGMKMAEVKLPIIELPMTIVDAATAPDLDNSQVNPSCILAYLGIRGIGMTTTADESREFHAIALLTYWDAYKNYYANKQEGIGMVIHTSAVALVQTVDTITITNNINSGQLPQPPLTDLLYTTPGTTIEIAFTGATPIPSQIMVNTQNGLRIPMDQLLINWVEIAGPDRLVGTYNYARWGALILQNWSYLTASEVGSQEIAITEFDLTNIDDTREAILGAANGVPFDIGTLTPFLWLKQITNGFPNMLNTQEGLAIKTYQSDLFNNWIQTEYITGPTGINEITAIDTSGGDFNIDTLILSKKVYDMLNRIALSGGTYRDYIRTVWTAKKEWQPETPVYMGGLSKELAFQEVVSNSTVDSEDGGQPLGTLAGKGVMTKKHKGGHVTIHVDEPGWILGLISITPRIDYSQGNKWNIHLKTMDDFHKPALDQIGFQDLITEQMAWWSTSKVAGLYVFRSAGKQPAWINYMTNVNVTYGNFAIRTNEMFMTLNRRYEYNIGGLAIEDLTTYIDPSKFNFIFAQTSLDSQNFWVSVAVDITVRQKMSAKVMPNL